MTLKVELGFTASGASAPFLTLDNPIAGQLDNPDWTLGGGEVLVDVTSYVRKVLITRGKSRELDRYGAGSASVEFNNDGREFDPTYVDSPFFGQIVPRRQIKITHSGIVQYEGVVDDWNLFFDPSGFSIATCQATDNTSVLANIDFVEPEEAYDDFLQETTGDRINAVLDFIGWNDEREIDEGSSELFESAIPLGDNVLQYLQLVSDSEPGDLFIGKSGQVVFRGRNASNPGILLTDTDEGIRFNQVSVVYGSENLYNRVVVTRLGGSPQIADSPNSQALYGIQTLSLDGLLMVDDEEALGLAQYLLGVYDEPEIRITSVEVNLHDKTPEQQGKLLQVELQDVFKVVFTPNGIGSPIEQYADVTGIKHSIGIAQHKITFDFGSIRKFPFILDHPVYGVLGGGLPLYDALNAIYDDPQVRYNGTENSGNVTDLRTPLTKK